MTANPLQVVDGLVTALRTFTSDDNCKAIAGVFDEISLRKRQIEPKDAELGRLRDAIGGLKFSPEAGRRQELELHRTQYSRLARN